MTSCLFALVAPVANAANAAQIEAESVWEFLSAGGPLMVPLALCSVLALAFTFDRLLALRRSRFFPAQTREALAAAEAGDWDAAQRLLGELETPAGRILSVGLRRRGLPLRDIERGMEDQGAKESDRLQRNIRPLQLVAAVAPLLGLLGTVIGIADAFARVKSAGTGRPELLAEGIETALVTTIAGLCVAIPALLVAAWLQARARDLVLEVDERFAVLVERLARPQEASRADPD